VDDVDKKEGERREERKRGEGGKKKKRGRIPQRLSAELPRTKRGGKGKKEGRKEKEKYSFKIRMPHSNLRPLTLYSVFINQ